MNRFAIIAIIACFAAGCGKKGSGKTASELNPDRKTYDMVKDPSLKVDYSKLGVIPYPGAKPADGVLKMMQIKSPEGIKYNASWLSTDAPPKVIAFYKKEVTVDTVVDTPSGGILTGKNRAAHDFALVVSLKNKKTLISITVTRPD